MLVKLEFNLKTVGKYYFGTMAVRMSENPGVQVLFGDYNLSPLVEIGLTNLPKSGGAMAASPAPPGKTGLNQVKSKIEACYSELTLFPHIIPFLE